MYLQLAIWKNYKFLVFLFSFIFCLATEAQTQSKVPSATWKEIFGWSSSTRFASYSRDTSFQTQQGYFVSGLWLNFRPKEMLGFNFYIDGYVQGQNLNRNNYSVGDLREFYIDRSIGWFDMRIGRQIISWGRADKINPTDVWSLSNLNLLVSDDEDQKTGLLTSQFAFNFSNIKIITLLQSEWRSPGFPVTPLPAGITISHLNPDTSQSQYGLKVDYSGGSFDGSLSYSHVIDKTPDLSVVSMNAGVQLGFLYSMVDVYGFDFAKTIGQYGIRSECAYTKTLDISGTNGLIKNSNTYCVFGGDRTFDTFNFNIQIIYKRVDNFQNVARISDPNLQYLAIQENIISNQITEETNGLSLRISDKGFNDKLESELTVVSWWKYGDCLVRPKLKYSFSDSFRGAIGAESYAGPSVSYFGRLKDISRVFLETRYLF